MENIIIVAVIVLIIALAGFYVYKAKKNGKKCIGCPDRYSCDSKNNGPSSCSCGCCGAEKE